MPLEDLTGPNKYLDALNRDWPLGSDAPSEGDDHIRGHKNVNLNTFPGPNGNGLEEPVHVERAAIFAENENGTDRQGSLEMAVGTTAQRPADGALAKGHTRWNETTNRLETWDGAAWIELHAMAALTSMFRAKQNLEADVAALAHVSSDEAVAFTRALGTILDATGGSEEGALIFEAVTGGALAEALRVIGAGASSPRWHRRSGGSDTPQEGEDIIAEGTVAADSSFVDIGWTNDGYEEVEVRISDMRPKNATAFAYMQFSSLGLPNSGLAYHGALLGTFSAGSSQASQSFDQGQVLLGMSLNPQNNGPEPCDIKLIFDKPHRTDVYPHCRVEYLYGLSGNYLASCDGHAWYRSNGSVDGVRLFFNVPQSDVMRDEVTYRVIGRK